MFFKKMFSSSKEKRNQSAERVTVVMVTFNAADLLEKTILSVLDQDYKALEYIIIDGASSDGTVEIIKKYENSLAAWVSEPDEGVYFAMNKAIEMATGDWINFMNAGDTFVGSSTVSDVMKESGEGIDLIYGANYVIGGGQRSLIQAPTHEQFLKYPAICHQTLFTKAFLLKALKFDTSYRICADYDFEMKCEQMGCRFKRLAYPIANFLEGGLNHREIYRTRIEGISILLKYKNIEVAKQSQMSQRLIVQGYREEQKSAKAAKPLLVTGSHRSGTTWIGKALEMSSEFRYVNEPMNLDTSGGLVGEWFHYVQQPDEPVVKYLQDENEESRRLGLRTLYKDPISFFSIDTYINELKADVLISVRHPAAFVGSLKRLGWTHDFSHFLRQEVLMQTYLYPFRDQIHMFTLREYDVVDQGILLWNLINLNVMKFKQKYPQIMVVRHEDLSLEPVEKFKEVFENFQVTFSPEAQRYLCETTSVHGWNEVEKGRVHQLKRDSRKNVYNFKERLSVEEFNRVREGTEMISHLFYDIEWWEGHML